MKDVRNLKRESFRKELASHADVLGGSSRAGTRDEPLRSSAWEIRKE